MRNLLRGRPASEQASLEVIAAVVTIVHGGPRVLRRFARLGLGVMGGGSVALALVLLRPGELIVTGVVSSIGSQTKLSIAAARRASWVDLSLVLSAVKGQSRSIAGASAFSSEPLRPLTNPALRYAHVVEVGKEVR